LMFISIVITSHLSAARADRLPGLLPADPSSVVKTLHSNGIHLQGACFEAGPTGFKLARVLKSEDIPVIVAAPSKVPRSVSLAQRLTDLIASSWLSSHPKD
jgi:transposase